MQLVPSGAGAGVPSADSPPAVAAPNGSAEYQHRTTRRPRPRSHISACPWPSVFSHCRLPASAARSGSASELDASVTTGHHVDHGPRALIVAEEAGEEGGHGGQVKRAALVGRPFAVATAGEPSPVAGLTTRLDGDDGAVGWGVIPRTCERVVTCRRVMPRPSRWVSAAIGQRRREDIERGDDVGRLSPWLAQWCWSRSWSAWRWSAGGRSTHRSRARSGRVPWCRSCGRRRRSPRRRPGSLAAWSTARAR
jgi:hypothetical protein